MKGYKPYNGDELAHLTIMVTQCSSDFTLIHLLSLLISSLTDLAGEGISHFDLLGVDSSSSQLLREGVLISDRSIIQVNNCLVTLKRFLKIGPYVDT